MLKPIPRKPHLGFSIESGDRRSRSTSLATLIGGGATASPCELMLMI